MQEPTTRVSEEERAAVPSVELKRRLLAGGLPVRCERTQHAGEDGHDDDT